jgi:hypothetical protein
MFNKTLEALSPAMSQVSKAGKAILSDYQNDSKGIGGSAAVLEAGLNIAGSTAQMAGKGMTGVGTAMMTIPGPAMAVGAVLTAVGTGLTLFGGVTKEVAEKVLPFLKTELENNIKSFQSLTASGALFGNGISGMIKTAGNAGLTLVQFDRVVKENRESLATLGGVGAGSIALSNNLKKANETIPNFKNQMLNLGFGFEEQAGLMATVMSNMQRMGRTADAGLVASATADYARNLRVIANITGEDAKKKEEEVRQQSAQVEFRRKLMEIEKEHPGASQRILQQMQMLTPQMQKNVMEQMTLGRTVNETGAILESQSGSFRDGVKGFVDAAKSGMTDQEGTQVLIGKAMDGFKEEVGSGKFAGIGMAGMAGHLGDLNKALSETILYSDKVTEANVKASQAAAAAQQQTADKQTVAANKVIEVNQKMAIAIQQQILDSDVMGTYAEAVEDATNAMLDMIKKFTGNRDKTPAEQATADIKAANKAQIQATGFGENNIKPEQIEEQIAARQAELDARAKLPADRRRGTIRDVNAERIEILKQQIEDLKKARTEDATPTENGATATPTPPAPSVAPVAPVQPTPVPVSENEDLSKLTAAQINKRIEGMSADQRIDFMAKVKAAKQAAVQPKQPKNTATGTPAANVPVAGAVATPINPLSSATPTPDSILGNNGTAPAAQQQTAASGGSIGDDKMIATAKATEDKNNEQLIAMRKQIALQEDTIEILREVARHSRTTAEAA